MNPVPTEQAELNCDVFKNAEANCVAVDSGAILNSHI